MSDRVFSRKDWEEIEQDIFTLLKNVRDIRSRDTFLEQEFIKAVDRMVTLLWPMDLEELPEELGEEIARLQAEGRI